MEKVARRLCVPFNVFKPAKVDVWLTPVTTVTEDGVALACLVDVDSYVRRALAGVDLAFNVPVESLTDHSEWLRGHGGSPHGRVVSYADLSRFGWGIGAPGVSNRYSYWTVFFAQNVVRGLGLRLIGCEMAVLSEDAEGKEVHFRPWLKALQREIKGYGHVKPVRDMKPWVRDQVVETWSRITAGLTQDVNRKALDSELKRGTKVRPIRPK